MSEKHACVTSNVSVMMGCGYPEKSDEEMKEMEDDLQRSQRVVLYPRGVVQDA